MILYNKTGHFALRQFLTLRSDTSFRSFYIQNKMIETPGAKIRQKFLKIESPYLTSGRVLCSDIRLLAYSLKECRFQPSSISARGSLLLVNIV